MNDHFNIVGRVINNSSPTNWGIALLSAVDHRSADGMDGTDGECGMRECDIHSPNTVWG